MRKLEDVAADSGKKSSDPSPFSAVDSQSTKHSTFLKQKGNRFET